jgi:putative transposase
MADTSISGARVARELDALVRVYGKPACIVSDNVLCAEYLADLASGHSRVEASQHVQSMA